MNRLSDVLRREICGYLRPLDIHRLMLVSRPCRESARVYVASLEYARHLMASVVTLSAHYYATFGAPSEKTYEWFRYTACIRRLSAFYLSIIQNRSLGCFPGYDMTRAEIQDAIMAHAVSCMWWRRGSYERSVTVDVVFAIKWWAEETGNKYLKSVFSNKTKRDFDAAGAPDSETEVWHDAVLHAIDDCQLVKNNFVAVIQTVIYKVRRRYTHVDNEYKFAITVDADNVLASKPRPENRDYTAAVSRSFNRWFGHWIKPHISGRVARRPQCSTKTT